jgi:phytoene dehydrogenase-like protein
VSDSYDAIIVGAGHNGMVAGTYLARSGLNVLILERKDVVGGACITEELLPGFRFSSCAHITWIIQSQIVRELQLRKNGLVIYPLEPKYFAAFRDGRHFTIWSDMDKTVRSISRMSPTDGKNFLRWSEFWNKAGSILHYFFLKGPPSLADLLRRAKQVEGEEVLTRVLTSSMQQMVEDFFDDEDVRGWFGNYGLDFGDPTAPGSAYCAAYMACSDFTDPRDYGVVKGGMGSVTQTLEKVAVASGVKIVKGAEVSEITIKNGKATGVNLKGGRKFASKAVISNADPKRTFLKLVDEDALEASFVKKVKNISTKAGCLKLMCALDEFPDFSRYLGKNFDRKIVAETGIVPRIEEQRKSWEAAKNGKTSRHPDYWISFPTIFDKTVAPPGKHILSAFVQYAPTSPSTGSWEKIKEAEKQFLLDDLSDFIPNLRKSLIGSVLLTPADIAKKTNLTDGNIRQVDMIPGQLGDLRPASGMSGYRTPIRGLYLCGGGTYPMGEVTCAPGYNAANVVIQDIRSAPRT